MATPASHAAAATTLLNSIPNDESIVFEVILAQARANAQLGRCAGTGSAYTAAEAALTFSTSDLLYQPLRAKRFADLAHSLALTAP